MAPCYAVIAAIYAHCRWVITRLIFLYTRTWRDPGPNESRCTIQPPKAGNTLSRVSITSTKETGEVPDLLLDLYLGTDMGVEPYVVHEGA